MEKHLITMTIRTRVEPGEEQKAIIHAAEEKIALVLLGTKGSSRTLIGLEQVGKYRPDQYAVYARMGLLYVQPLSGAERQAFAPALDEKSGLPVLLQDYHEAFAMRSKEGVQQPAAEAAQTTRDLNS